MMIMLRYDTILKVFSLNTYVYDFSSFASDSMPGSEYNAEGKYKEKRFNILSRG